MTDKQTPKKRKLSAKQTDKGYKEAAKYLKKRGFISKQTDLHQGRHISRAIVRKVEQFQREIAADYKTVKVTKKIASRAKEAGFVVVGGNKVVIPSDRKFENRLKKGNLSGVTPVRGGFLESVVLPYDVMDMRGLVEDLRKNPKALDNLKLSGEKFAFKLYGNLSYETFYSAQKLIEYLEKYRSIFDAAGDLRSEHLDEIYQNLSFYKLQAVDERGLIPSRDQRDAARKARGRALIDGRRGRTNAERNALRSPELVARFKRKSARIAKANREAMSDEERQAYREKARVRAQLSRDRRK